MTAGNNTLLFLERIARGTPAGAEILILWGDDGAICSSGGRAERATHRSTVLLLGRTRTTVPLVFQTHGDAGVIRHRSSLEAQCA